MHAIDVFADLQRLLDAQQMEGLAIGYEQYAVERHAMLHSLVWTILVSGRS
jgi:hypothetical protein